MLVNACSIRSNDTLIRDHIESTKPSIIGVTETSNRYIDGDFVLANMAPDGYIWRHINRSESRGGGLAILYQRDIKYAVRKTLITQHIELLWCMSQINNKALHYAIIYRPPS